eukprot:c67_g1_i1.p1 GENE.c67_g1_i1~~c67_g1_i1.p1  ORF type:complete len:719 (-),score=163.47 c67_g1_i1:14-2170(-)
MGTLTCPKFDTCSGGTNELGGYPYKQPAVVIGVNTTRNIAGQVVIEKITRTPSRTCSAIRNDSMVLHPSCKTFDFLAQTLNMTLYEMFLGGLYWEDSFVDKVSVAPPDQTPPADTFHTDAVFKMLMDDGDDEDEWEFDEEFSRARGAQKQASTVTETVITCGTHQHLDSVTKTCECDTFWTGKACQIPIPDPLCDGLDIYTCTTVKELLTDCLVKEEDEIDLDCAKRGLDVFSCFKSGFPARSRRFEQFNTQNNTVLLRNSEQFAAAQDGWVLSLIPGLGFVSSGPLDCNCTNMGIRCACASPSYGNVTAPVVPEAQVIVSSPNSDMPIPRGTLPSALETVTAGEVFAVYDSESRGTDSEYRYNEVRVDGAGASPYTGNLLSQAGWKEPIVLACSKCIGSPEIMNRVCDQKFLDHCHMLEGMTRNPLCNICIVDAVKLSIVTSNMDSDISVLRSDHFTTEKKLTTAETKYRRTEWDLEANNTRPTTLKQDVLCHLIEEDIDVEKRESDRECHQPNDLCAGLLDAEKENHPAKVANGYKNFGPLRCPHIRHCCMTEVDTQNLATCSFENTCSLTFIHPYSDCGQRPTGCLPSLFQCQFNYTSYTGNAICGKLATDTTYNPWGDKNARGCAAPSYIASETDAAKEGAEGLNWYNVVGKTKMYQSSNDISHEVVCLAEWHTWCAALDQGDSNGFSVPHGFYDLFSASPHYTQVHSICSQIP